MKIFITHSCNFDFQNELYKPIRNSAFNKRAEIYLPQEKGPEQVTKDLIKSCDYVVAEVSYPSTGQGIELGWANVFNVPIVCVYKKGSKLSNSLKFITDNFFEYETSDQLIQILENNLI